MSNAASERQRRDVSASLGHRPRDSIDNSKQALKARLNPTLSKVNRAFSAGAFGIHKTWDAVPGSELNTAPLARWAHSASLCMKARSPASNNAESRKQRALTVIAREKKENVPASVNLIAFRNPSAAERAYGKSLEPRARELRRAAQSGRKLRKLASTS